MISRRSRAVDTAGSSQTSSGSPRRCLKQHRHETENIVVGSSSPPSASQRARAGYACFKKFAMHSDARRAPGLIADAVSLVALANDAFLGERTPDGRILNGPATNDIAEMFVKMLQACDGHTCVSGRAAICAFAFDDVEQWLVCATDRCSDCFLSSAVNCHAAVLRQGVPQTQGYTRALQQIRGLAQQSTGIRALQCASRCSRELCRGPNRCIAFSPDGKTIATGSNKTAQVWDAATGDRLRVLEGHTKWVVAVAYSPDGATIATGSLDKTARVWDAASGKCLRVLEGHTKWVMAVAYSPDGATIVTGSQDKTVRLWDAESGECRRELEGHTDSVLSVAYSPERATIASGSADHTARVWDAESRECLRVLEGHTDSVMAVAYSRDGATIATGSRDKTARVWDAESGECRLELFGYTCPVNALAFSPDSRTIVTSADALWLWDAESGECRGALRDGGHYGGDAVAYSPDGTHVATCAATVPVRLWDVKLLGTGSPMSQPLQRSAVSNSTRPLVQVCASLPCPDPCVDAPVSTTVDFDRTKFVALEDGGQRWLVDRAGLMAYSKVARNRLEHTDDDEVLPLNGTPHYTDTTIALFATWINHYASSPTAVPTKVSYPLPGGLPDVLAPWDRAFIKTLVVPAGDMTASKELWLLAGMAVSLESTVLAELCCAYLALRLRSSTRNPSIRSWFGLDGDFSPEKLEAIKEDFFWCFTVDHRKLQMQSDEAHALVAAWGSAAAAAST